MQLGKSSVWVSRRIDNDFNLRSSKLLRHCIQIPNPKIDHPLLVGMSEIICVVREWSEDHEPGFLRLRLLTVVTAHKIDSQVLLVPLTQGRRVLRAKKQSSNSSNMLHTVFWLLAISEKCP